MQIMCKIKNNGTKNVGIHSSVFPSAHVSAAFSCAWGLLIAMPDRRRYGRIVVAYAFLVAIATVYGRYHYATDALAGFAISFLAFAALGQRPGRTDVVPPWRE